MRLLQRSPVLVHHASACAQYCMNICCMPSVSFPAIGKEVRDFCRSAAAIKFIQQQNMFATHFVYKWYMYARCRISHISFWWLRELQIEAVYRRRSWPTNATIYLYPGFLYLFVFQTFLRNSFGKKTKTLGIGLFGGQVLLCRRLNHEVYNSFFRTRIVHLASHGKFNVAVISTVSLFRLAVHYVSVSDRHQTRVLVMYIIGETLRLIQEPQRTYYNSPLWWRSIFLIACIRACFHIIDLQRTLCFFQWIVYWRIYCMAARLKQYTSINKFSDRTDFCVSRSTHNHVRVQCRSKNSLCCVLDICTFMKTIRMHRDCIETACARKTRHTSTFNSAAN